MNWQGNFFPQQDDYELSDNAKNLKETAGSSYFSLFLTSREILRIIKYFSPSLISKLPVAHSFQTISQVKNKITFNCIAKSFTVKHQM